MFRRFSVAHPRIIDWVLAVVPQLPMLAIGALLASEPTMRIDGSGMIASAAAAGSALLWRRRRPLSVTVVCALLLMIPSNAAAGAFFAVHIALYSLGAYARARIAWVGVAVVSACSVLGTLFTPVFEPGMIGPFVSVNLLAIAFFVMAVLIGTSVRSRRSYVDQLIARASDLQRDRDQQARLAVAAERARIAREMHDVVSHGLTVMVALAEGSAAHASRDAERASATMRSVADTGRASLAEMRRLLGVLREPGDGAELAPQPASGDLQALVASFRDAGMPVRLTTSGSAIDDPSLALTVHRIVQEALTNVLRHAADASRVDVTVQQEGGAVRIEVVDDGSGAPASTTGAGRGIIGIRERAALFGGAAEAGSRAPQGWRLAATLRAARAA